MHRLLDTLDVEPLSNLLEGLVEIGWHLLIRHWSESQAVYSPLISEEAAARRAEMLARASAILTTKVPLQSDAFNLTEDTVAVLITQMTKFEWASVPKGQAMPLQEGCQGLIKMLISERCRELITTTQLASITECIRDSLVSKDVEEEQWDLMILEAISQALLESCRGVLGRILGVQARK